MKNPQKARYTSDPVTTDNPWYETIDGQMVTVERRLGEDEVGEVEAYLITADDGDSGIAYAHELDFTP